MTSRPRTLPLAFPFVWASKLGISGWLYLVIILILQVLLSIFAVNFLLVQIELIHRQSSLPLWLLQGVYNVVPYIIALFFSLFGTVAVANAARIRFFNPTPTLLTFIETYPSAWSYFTHAFFRSSRVMFYVILPAIAMGVLYTEFVSKLEVRSAYWLYVAGCIAVFGVVMSRVVPLFLSPFVALISGSAPYAAMQASHQLVRGQALVLIFFSFGYCAAIIIGGVTLSGTILLSPSLPRVHGMQGALALLTQIYSVAGISYCFLRAAAPPPPPGRPPPNQSPKNPPTPTTKVEVEKIWVE